MPWPVSGFELVARRERGEVLIRCMSVLGRRSIRVIRLRYERGLTFRQITLAMDGSEEAIFKLHGRAIDRLREEMTALGIRKLKDIL